MSIDLVLYGVLLPPLNVGQRSRLNVQQLFFALSDPVASQKEPPESVENGAPDNSFPQSELCPKALGKMALPLGQSSLVSTGTKLHEVKRLHETQLALPGVS